MAVARFTPGASPHVWLFSCDVNPVTLLIFLSNGLCLMITFKPTAALHRFNTENTASINFKF